MKPREITVNVVLKGHGDSFGQGTIRIQKWSDRERFLRAAKFGGACWGLAVLSVLLPLLHFILVPGFFLAGPILAFILIGQKAIVLGGEGTCPHCRKTMRIVRSTPDFPLSDTCDHCQGSSKIEPEDKDLFSS